MSRHPLAPPRQEVAEHNEVKQGANPVFHKIGVGTRGSGGKPINHPPPSRSAPGPSCLRCRTVVFRWGIRLPRRVCAPMDGAGHLGDGVVPLPADDALNRNRARAAVPRGPRQGGESRLMHQGSPSCDPLPCVAPRVGGPAIRKQRIPVFWIPPHSGTQERGPAQPSEGGDLDPSSCPSYNRPLRSRWFCCVGVGAGS